jgi:hypothetical protein
MKKDVEGSDYGFILKALSWHLPRGKEKTEILRQDCRSPGQKFEGTRPDKSEACCLKHLLRHHCIHIYYFSCISLLFIPHLKPFQIKISGLDKITISCCLPFLLLWQVSMQNDNVKFKLNVK